MGEEGRETPLLLNAQGGAAIGLEIGVNFISILLTDFLSKSHLAKNALSSKRDVNTKIM